MKLHSTGALLALALACAPAVAGDKLVPLADADAAGLQGKTVAFTVHERPSFSAMTAGKASFGLFGAGAMGAEGNKLVDGNGVADPAGLVREQLAAVLRDRYGMQLLAVDAAPTKAKKPKELAATHPEADYVFDVRSGGWMYAYYPTAWGTYWVGYSVQAQLIDTKTGRQVTNAACNANTRDNKNPPSREHLHADGAKLLKDVTMALGWTCVQLLSREQMKVPADQVAAIPAEYVDPLAAAKSAAPVATPTSESAQPAAAGTTPSP